MRGFCRVEVDLVDGFGKNAGVGPASDGIGHLPEEIHTFAIGKVDVRICVLEVLLELLEGLWVMLVLNTVYFSSAGRNDRRAAVGIAQLVKVRNLGLLQIGALNPAGMDFGIGKTVLCLDTGNLLVAALPVLHGDADTAKNVV